MSTRNHKHLPGLFGPVALSLLCFLLFINMTLVEQKIALADTIKGAIRQRIGNYDMEMKTIPSNPVEGTNTKIQLRIGSVEGDELIDIPVVIRLSKGGLELARTNPISVTYGHYIFPYTFNQTGIYSLDVDVYDTSYNSQNITFTFPVTVISPYLSFFMPSQPLNVVALEIVLVVASIICGVAGTIYIRRKKARAMES
ncbi:MAG: hypothetical protein WAL66_15645 [Nitrososphaeraceae archaeon]